MRAMTCVLLVCCAVLCCPVQVASQRQAADDAINRHMDALMDQLAAAEPKAPSAPRLAATATAAGSGQDTPLLWSDLKALGSAQACLDEMMDMSESEVRVAWKYLRQMGAVKEKRRQWDTLWKQLEQARRTVARERVAPQAPWWLSSSWDEFHEQQRLREEKQREQQEAEAAAAAEAAGATPWGDTNALQQSVLVLVSDDRGFATIVARWLRKGGAGVLLVTTRGLLGWERPLREAFAACGCNTLTMWQAVCVVSWDDIVSDLEPVGWVDDDDDWEMEGFDDGHFGRVPKLPSYEWMVSQGLL